MKIKSSLILFAVLALAVVSQAQITIGNSTNGPTISFGGVTVPAIIGTPITINGQTLLLGTNSAGGLVVSTSGPDGTNMMTVPQNAQQVIATGGQWVQQNNPANVGYYSTNGEWEFKLGGAYSQNSGQGAALISVERWGLISKWPNISAGAAVLEGNQGGQNGTAAALAFVDYRRPIGDVAFVMGLGGGYDNYTAKPMAIVKVDIEYRQNSHLGEWVGAFYDFEGLGHTVTQTGANLNNPSGLGFGGGICYAFDGGRGLFGL